MIGYPIPLAALEAAIDGESPDWRERTRERTAAFRRLGRYAESSSLWSEIKVVYMRLQGGSKCAYCERKLESEQYGKGEQDVEHFRPKKSVKVWPMPESLTRLGIICTAAPPAGQGYYLLPYHPLNYAAACKPCNSALKRDYFPIAGRYDLSGDDPGLLLKERPYLIYPIGNFDAPPETLIEFYGLSPRPIANEGWERDRALVTITFFRLADATQRKNLFRERAMLLLLLFPQLETAHDERASEEARRVAHVILADATRPDTPHCNASRSFVRLYRANPSEARAFFHEALQFIHSVS